VDIRPTTAPCARPTWARRLALGLPVWITYILTTTNSNNGSKVLTAKEQERLKAVRQKLESNSNPYESVNTLSLGSTDRKAISKELSDDERRAKFAEGNLEYGSHKWQFIDGTSDVIPDKQLGPVCIACHKAVNTVTAVYGRVISQMLRKVIHLLKNTPETGIIEVMKIVGIPVYETGYCCQHCFDILYALRYEDWEGNTKRGIELVDKPILKVKESYSVGGRERIHTVPAAKPFQPRRDDNYPRGKDKLKRVSTVSLGKGGVVLEAEDEEWNICKLPKQAVNDLPDPTCFHKFTKSGRRKVG